MEKKEKQEKNDTTNKHQENGVNKNVENEQFKNDLELIFAYARTHSTNINPMNEQELIHIINLKSEVFRKLNLQ